jgi:N-acetyl sugar amidotransferase
MKYCTRCILPETRPGIEIDDEGICSACRNFDIRPDIDWAAREAAFEEVIANAKRRSKGYDCLIPVSGGKDSTWQVVKCLEKGLNPLCVTWRPPGRTQIGQENLDNMIRLGVDHIDYSISPETEKKFMLAALKRFGSTGTAMHMALFNLPLQIALKLEISLVVWGENSAFEYGDTSDDKMGFRLDKNWFKKFGVTHGTSAEDWVSDDLTKANLTPYFGPDLDELERQGVLAVFLGYYYEWDVEMTRRVAKEHGFKENTEGARTGIYNFADIDDDFISIHHYVKWHKFGCTRSFDNLSLEIRNGRMTREQAIKVVREQKDCMPREDIEKFCRFAGITWDEFFEIVETFRNHDIWEKAGGKWKIKNFLVPDFDWDSEIDSRCHRENQ